MKRVSSIIGLGILAVTLFVTAPAHGLIIQTVPWVCTPPPSGLVSWWPGEGSAVDIIGGNAGTLVGGASFAAGKVGQGFNLSNSDAYVSVPLAKNLDVGAGDGFTLEAWINTADITRAEPIFEWNDDVWWGVHFHVASGQVTGGSDGPSGDGQLYANIVDSNGNWHQLGSAAGVIASNVFEHVALTYDKASGVATMYCNGQIVSQANIGSLTPQTAAPFHLNLGRRQAANDQFYSFAGRIDEPAVYNRALAASEITAIVNAGIAGKCAPQCVSPPAGLVAWWPGNGNGNDIIGGHNAIVPAAGVTFTNAMVGQGFDFDGSENQMNVPDAPALNFGAGQDFSIEAWIVARPAPENFESEEMAIVDKRYAPNAGNCYGYHLYVYQGHLIFQMSDVETGGPGSIDSGGPDMRDGRFHHVAVTVQRNSTTGGVLYVDGQPVQVFNPTSHAGSLVNNDYLRIGNTPTPGYRTFFHGIIDDLSLYNRSLSSNEIAAVYAAGSAGKCNGGGPSLPVITTPPASQTVIEGNEVDLFVNAFGVGSLSYQWLFNGKKIAGAIGTAYSVPNIHPNQAGNYAVKVTGTGGSVTSAPAIITVIKQNILIYNYSGSEKITGAGKETSYGFSGQLIFIPDTTNAIFVGWANINNKRQYWVSPVSDYLWFKISGSVGRTYTVLGKAGTTYDYYGRPNLWTFQHKGQNTTLLIATRKTFSFPGSFVFNDTQIYPDPQTGSPILREASSNYGFVQNSTQAANDNGQTVNDLVAALVKSLVKQGYQPQ